MGHTRRLTALGSLSTILLIGWMGKSYYNSDSKSTNASIPANPLMTPLPASTRSLRQLGYTSSHHLVDTLPSSPSNFAIEPIVDIPLPKSSVFLVCVRPTEDAVDLVCHFRQHAKKNLLGRVILDAHTFRIKSPIDRTAISDTRDRNIYSTARESITPGEIIYGEDPRTFMWNGEVFVLNNEKMGSTLMQMRPEGGVKYSYSMPVFLGKKNVTPIPTNGNGIMFIDMQDEVIHSCVREDNNSLDLRCEAFYKPTKWTYANHPAVDPADWFHRGGTPGYEIEHGVFIGFGHGTNRQVKTHHDIFHWKLDVRGEQAVMSIDYVVVSDSLDSSISDPTCLLRVDNEWFLFTAESEDLWGKPDVVFINRIYKLKPRMHEFQSTLN